MNALSPSAEEAEVKAPVAFVALCVLAFAAGVGATAYFCRSMCGDMKMTGGWSMSMMWMHMPGQSWIGSAFGFLLMWLAMMVAMMMPSALPTFLKTQRPPSSLPAMAVGYFAVWLVAGAGLYVVGIPLAAAAMRWDLFSRAVPILLGTALIAAGAIQLTRWKMAILSRCRSPFGCAVSCLGRQSGFRLGCEQGAACCVCCIAPMTIQLAIGIMNPLAMVGVAGIIAAEKILPRPEIVARFVGVFAIVAGVATMAGLNI